MGLWTILVLVCLPFAVLSHIQSPVSRDTQSNNDKSPLIQVDHQRCLSITRQTRYVTVPMPYLCRPGQTGGVPVPPEMNDQIAIVLLNLYGEGYRICQHEMRVPVHRYIPVPVCCPGWAKDPVGGCTISTYLMKKGFCLNGGIPVMKNGPPACVCAPGFAGPICQFNKQSTSQSRQQPKNNRPMSFTKSPMQFANGPNTRSSFKPPHQMPNRLNNRIPMQHQMPRGMNNRMPMQHQMPRGMNNRIPMQHQMPRGMNNRIPMQHQMPKGMNKRMPMEQQMPKGMNNRMPVNQQTPIGMNNRIPMNRQTPRGMYGPMLMRQSMTRIPTQSRMQGPMRQMRNQGRMNVNNRRMQNRMSPMMGSRSMNNMHQMPQSRMMRQRYPGMRRAPVQYRNRFNTRIPPHNVQFPLNRIQLMRARLTPDGRSVVVPCKMQHGMSHLITLRRPIASGRFGPNQRVHPVFIQKLMAEKAKQFTGIPNTLPLNIVNKMNRVMISARKINPMINPAAINPVPSSSNSPRPVVAPPVVLSKRPGIPLQENQAPRQPQSQPQLPKRVQMMMEGYNEQQRCRKILETGVSRCFKNAGIIAAPSDIFNPQNPSIAGKICGLGGRVGPCIMAGETACGGGMRIILTRRMLSQLLGAISNFCQTPLANNGLSSSRSRMPQGPLFPNSPQQTRFQTSNARPRSSMYPGANMDPRSNMPRGMNFPQRQMLPNRFAPNQHNPRSDINDDGRMPPNMPDFPQPNTQEETRDIMTDGPNSDVPLPEDTAPPMPEYPLEDELHNLVVDPQLECLNGGELVPEEGVAVCLCPVEFTGVQCETPMEDMMSPEDPIPVDLATDMIDPVDPNFGVPPREDIFDPSRPSRLDINTEMADPPMNILNDQVDPRFVDPNLIDQPIGDSFNPVDQPMNVLDEEVDPSLADPGLVDQGFVDPGLSDPELADQGFADPGLGDPELADQGFADPGLGDPELADQGLVDPSTENVFDPVVPQMNIQNDQGVDLQTNIQNDERIAPGLGDSTTEDRFDPSRPSRLDVKTETELANKMPKETPKTGNEIPVEPVLPSADDTNKVVDKESLVSDAGASAVPVAAKSKDYSKKESIEVAGFPLWMILAIALGFLFLLFIVCLTLCVCVKCRKTKTVEITQLPEKMPLPDSMYTISALPPTYESQGISPLSYEEAKGETIYAVVKKEKKEEKEKEEKDNKDAKEEESVDV